MSPKTFAHLLKRNGAYLLVENDPMAKMFEWGGSPARGLEAAFRLSSSLDRAQIRDLMSGATLALQQLTPDQQTLLATVFNMDYFQHPQRYSKETFVRKSGVGLRLLRTSDGRERLAFLSSWLLPDGVEHPMPFMTIQYPPPRPPRLRFQ